MASTLHHCRGLTRGPLPTSCISISASPGVKRTSFLKPSCSRWWPYRDTDAISSGVLRETLFLVTWAAAIFGVTSSFDSVDDKCTFQHSIIWNTHAIICNESLMKAGELWRPLPTFRRFTVKHFTLVISLILTSRILGIISWWCILIFHTFIHPSNIYWESFTFHLPWGLYEYRWT